MFSNLYKLDTVSIRPFNVFGPNQKGDSPYACAVSAWLYAVKHGKPLRSDGTGQQTRDITFVDDVVDIFFRAATFNEKLNGEAFNAGTQTSISNNAILNWFKQNFPNCSVVGAPWRDGDVMHTLASMVKTRNTLKCGNSMSFLDALEITKKWCMSSELF
jgi:nucleoside-diphosphate-sugar epimerase